MRSDIPGRGPRDPRLNPRAEALVAALAGLSYRAVRSYLGGRARPGNAVRIERALQEIGRADLILVRQP
jgi:hypothetical protein